jgi:hypothetical protein
VKKKQMFKIHKTMLNFICSPLIWLNLDYTISYLSETNFNALLYTKIVSARYTTVYFQKEPCSYNSVVRFIMATTYNETLFLPSLFMW